MPELELDNRMPVIEQKSLVDQAGGEKFELLFQNGGRPVDDVGSSIVSNQDIGRSLEVAVTQASSVEGLHQIAQVLKERGREPFLLFKSFHASAVDFLKDQRKASDDAVKGRNSIQPLESSVSFLFSPDQKAADKIPEHPAVNAVILDNRSGMTFFDPVQSRPRGGRPSESRHPLLGEVR